MYIIPVYLGFMKERTLPFSRGSCRIEFRPFTMSSSISCADDMLQIKDLPSNLASHRSYCVIKLSKFQSPLLAIYYQVAIQIRSVISVNHAGVMSMIWSGVSRPPRRWQRCRRHCRRGTGSSTQAELSDFSSTVLHLRSRWEYFKTFYFLSPYIADIF
jgi:hypothetical protein